MNNSEFDKEIIRVVADEIIAFDEANWERMQSMLDGKKENMHKMMLLPVLYKSYAAAATILFAVISILSLYTPKENIVVRQITNNKQEPPATNEPSSAVNHQPTTVQIATANKQFNTEKALVSQRNETEDVAKQVTDKTPDAIAKEDNTHLDKPIQQLPSTKKENILPLFLPYTDHKTYAKTTFGINTGMAVYQSYNSFAAGIMLNNRLNSRVSIQTGLGFVQGRQDISIKHVNVTEEPIVIITDTSQTSGVQRTVTERYEQQSSNLPYIQFNPGVSIKLYKKLYVVAGVDIQRVITDDATINTINEHLATTGKKLPKTDVGATVNLSYLLTKNIGAGISYRNSFAGKADNNTTYIQRNYFLIQMQYIFNR